MTKRWYLILVAVGAFLTALFTCEPFLFFTEYPLTAEGGYITRGILCVLAFLFLAFAVVFSFFKDNLLFLPISTLFSCLILIASAVPAMIFADSSAMFLYPILFSILLALLFTALSFCVCFLVKAEQRAKNRLAVLVIAVFSIATYISFYYQTPLLATLGLFNSVPPMGAAVAVMAIGLLFTLLKEKSSKLAFSIYIGIMALFFFASFILQIVLDGYAGGRAYEFTIFSSLIFVLLAAGYFIVSFVPACRKFLEKFNGAEEDGPQTPPAVAKAAVQVDPLDALEELQKLREAGVLTEEEFAAQKNKILGGM